MTTDRATSLFEIEELDLLNMCATETLLQSNGKISRTILLRLLKADSRPAYLRIQCDPYAGENLQLLKRAAKNNFHLYCRCETLDDADRMITAGLFTYMEDSRSCGSQTTPGGTRMLYLSDDDPGWGEFPQRVVLVLKN